MYAERKNIAALAFAMRDGLIYLNIHTPFAEGRKNSIRTLLGNNYAKNWDMLVAINMRKSVTILSQCERYPTLPNVIKRYQKTSYVNVLIRDIL